MGSSPPPPPPAPDPFATAQANSQANKTTSIGNVLMGNANETSPTGSVTYTRGADQTWTDETGLHSVPSFSRSVTLSPEQQQLYNQQTALGSQMNSIAGQQLNKIGGILSTSVDPNGLPAAQNSIPGGAPAIGLAPNAPTLQHSFDAGGNVQQNIAGSQDFSADRQRVEDALYSRLNPQLDRDRTSLETKLVNQGLQRGTEAFTNAMDEANRQANDARMGVVAQGGAEQSRLAGLDLAAGTFHNSAQQQQFNENQGLANFGNQAAQNDYSNQLGNAQFNNAAREQNFQNQQTVATFANTARERALQEQLALRNQPLNEISTLMHGGAVSMPQFTPFQASPQPPSTLSQDVYQSAAINSANWRQQAAATAQDNAGLYGLGGSILGLGAKMLPFSDRRVKANIERIGTRAGLPWYSFTYLGDNDNAPQQGFMADEVEKVCPAAVYDIGGIKAVDYALVLGAA